MAWFRLLAVVALLPLTAALSGCLCAPQTVPAVVSLSDVSEEVRTLPIVVSGATHIAGIELPDSHGVFSFDIDVSHNLTDIEVWNMTVRVDVGNVRIPVEIVHIEGGRYLYHDGDGTWAGNVLAGDRLDLYWVVDRDLIGTVAELVLSEGDSYALTLDFSWEHDGCDHKAKGVFRETHDDFVQASVNTRSLATDGEPFFEHGATGAGFRADYRITSGLDLTIDRATVIGVYFATDTTAELGVVTFPNVGWTVDGAEADVVTPNDVLRIQSTALAAASGTYGASGTLLPATLAAGPGLVVLLVNIAYTPTDPTLGAERDSFAYGILT